MEATRNLSNLTPCLDPPSIHVAIDAGIGLNLSQWNHDFKNDKHTVD